MIVGITKDVACTFELVTVNMSYDADVVPEGSVRVTWPTIALIVAVPV